MGKRLLCIIAITMITWVYTGPAMSSDAGPAEMKLVSSDSTKMPPAVFPHEKHQQAFECSECHHGMQDGKQIPYEEGMEIKKCESCHNGDVLAGKKIGRNELDTFKGAGHQSCQECHKDVAKKDASKKKLRSCKTCHQK